MALSAAGLASVLGAEAVTAAPTGLAAGISATALAAAATTGGSLTAALIHFMAMTKLKVAVGTIVTVGIGTAFVLEHQAQVRLRQENQALHQQAVQLAGETLRLSTWWLKQASRLRCQRTSSVNCSNLGARWACCAGNGTN